MTMTFEITQRWDGRPSGHDPITVTLSTSHKSDDAITLEVNAPFFNDPGNPGGEPGKPFDKLWDYEVVEAFFLGEDDKYLEVELCPHGQHIVLILHGHRNLIKNQLALDFHATITKDTWTGSAEIPLDYLPPKTSLFNAYAIHVSDPNRHYEALYPVPQDKYPNPDFHRLEYFKPIDLSLLVTQPDHSKLWDTALKQ